MQVTLEEAASRFADLVQQAAAGEEIIVTQNEQPLVKISGMRRDRPRAQAGRAKGRVWLAPDFDEPLEEFKDYM